MGVIASLFVIGGGGATAASIQIVSPAPEQILPGPDVPVHVVTEGIQFLPGGCNLHIILDDGPFAVQYDPSHPFLLRDVAPGSHFLRVFAADRLHRAMPGTLDVVTFSVGYQDEFNRPSFGTPLLTVNLPQGEYLGVDAGDVAIDFMVDGIDLSRRGYHVAYYVNGRKFYAYNEGSRNLKGLPPGLHSVRFELLDDRGELVNGRYSSWEKVIELSPHKTRHVPTEDEVRRGMPVIESIKGAMTNGQPWIAGNPGPIALPRPTPVVVPGARTAAPVLPAGDGFTVRPGGRRVGAIPEAEDVEIGPGATDTLLDPAFSDIAPAGPVETQPLPGVQPAGFPGAAPAPGTEPLTVAPLPSSASASPSAKAAAAENGDEPKTPPATEDGKEEEKDSDRSQSRNEEGREEYERLSKANAARARAGDAATTEPRDLRPAAFRSKSESSTSSTLRADRTASGTAVRKVPKAKPVKDASSNGDASTSGPATELPAAEATKPDAERGRNRADKPDRQRERRERPERKRDTATEEAGSAADAAPGAGEAGEALPAPRTPSRRVGP